MNSFSRSNRFYLGSILGRFRCVSATSNEANSCFRLDFVLDLSPSPSTSDPRNQTPAYHTSPSTIHVYASLQGLMHFHCFQYSTWSTPFSDFPFLSRGRPHDQNSSPTLDRILHDAKDKHLVISYHY